MKFDFTIIDLLYLTCYSIITCAIFCLQRSLTWREYVSDSKSSLQFAYNQILALIPETIPEQFRLNSKDFSRDRNLPFPQLVSFLLSASASDKNCGLSSKIPEFFKHARRSGIFPSAKPCVPAAVRKARAKIPWQLFEDIFYNATDLADSLCADRSPYLWNSSKVYAIDGSKYTLPANETIRETFDPNSGLDKGKGHYPQCLVSTVYDVFRRFPIAYSIAPNHTSERDVAQLLLPHVPDNGIALLDRGYPSFGLISTFHSEYNGHFIFRCSSKNTFPAIEEFLISKKAEAQITIKPSQKYLKKCTPEQKALACPIQLRAIRMESPADGTISVLLTNLYDMEQYTVQSIIDLYYERYRIEEYYRHEKVIVGIEKFHSQSPEGIRQELFANAIVSVISRILISLTEDPQEKRRGEPQFKHAVLAFAHEAFLLTPCDPQNAVIIFKELLKQISSVKYYAQKNRSSYPRICKRPPNKWCNNRIKFIERAKVNELTLCQP